MRLATSSISLLLLVELWFVSRAYAFVRPHSRHHPSHPFANSDNQKKLLALQQSTNNNSYDISKPIFDLYSFRTVRGDALAKYNSLNQSEPLRINLAALACLTFIASPWLTEEVGVDATFMQTVAVALAGTAGSAALFVRECQRRSKQLTRLEKELQALDLTVRLPTNALADAPYQDAKSVRTLLRQNSIQLIVVRGTAAELRGCLLDLQVLGRRLVQANSFVLVVPTDHSDSQEWGLSKGSRLPWLAQTGSLDDWKAYFDDTLVTDTQTTTFRWFGLKATGRTFGSGSSVPSWLQIMGRNILPTAVLSEQDRSVAETEQEQVVLDQQQRFYLALTSGNESNLKGVYSTESIRAVDDIIEQGGRLDTWKTCLADGARPEGMVVADGDVTIVSDTTAYSTVIEFPSLIPGATLLAVQTWTRASNLDEWKLSKHQTIPWSDSPAGGTLICDCRGCVSLVRSR